MKAKYIGPMSMSNCALRICVSALCATRQTMKAIAPAACCGVFGVSVLNHWLFRRMAIRDDLGRAQR